MAVQSAQAITATPLALLLSRHCRHTTPCTATAVGSIAGNGYCCLAGAAGARSTAKGGSRRLYGAQMLAALKPITRHSPSHTHCSLAAAAAAAPSTACGPRFMMTTAGSAHSAICTEAYLQQDGRRVHAECSTWWCYVSMGQLVAVLCTRKHLNGVLSATNLQSCVANSAKLRNKNMRAVIQQHLPHLFVSIACQYSLQLQLQLYSHT